MNEFLTKFREQFPELSTTTDAVITRNETVAKSMVRGSEIQLLYAVAHLATVDDGQGGEITETKIGSVSVKYRTPAKDVRDTFWTRTEYGRIYLELRSRDASTGIGVRVYG